ncbi:MAG TPA: radical SAM protein [Candidatus Omnitrophica bacterium]|nr:radical SAM protein [Candidatus Omnitrophota bacterium]
MGHLYTPMKVFHYKDKIDSLPEETEEILAPIHIRIKPTNVCNHDCWYCAYKASDLQLGKDMVTKDFIPEEKMMEILDDIIEMGVKAVTFSGGGEPFAYPFLLKTVKRLADSPILFASLTNGARMKGEVADVFARHAKWVRVSMDGWDGPSYAKYRGVGDNEFNKVIQNMKDFKRYGGSCLLGVSYIVDQDNQAHVYDMLQKLRDIGVDSVKVSACIVSNEGRETNEYHKPFFNRVKDQLQKFQEDNKDGKLEIFDAYHEVDEKFKKDYPWCPYLQVLPVIGADLNIYPCQDKAYNLEEGLIGSIKNRRFKDFWFSDKSKFFKVNPSKVCNHHCVANVKNKLVLEYLNADQEHIGFV